jgi:hypothetical protein
VSFFSVAKISTSYNLYLYFSLKQLGMHLAFLKTIKMKSTLNTIHNLLFSSVFIVENAPQRQKRFAFPLWARHLRGAFNKTQHPRRACCVQNSRP